MLDSHLNRFMVVAIAEDKGDKCDKKMRKKVSSIKPHMSLVMRKVVFLVSDLVGHNPGCTATEGG